MRRTPAVKTTTSLIERKIKQSSKHYYKVRISQAFPKLFQRTGLDPPRSGKKGNHNTEGKVWEVNETKRLL